MRSQLSQPTPHPGTPGYMSPEQERTGHYLRPSSDVYALGLVLFEMLTGRNYYHVEPGTVVSELHDGVPTLLDELVASMLAQLPEKRPWDGKKVAKLLNDDMKKFTDEGVELVEEVIPESKRHLGNVGWRQLRIRLSSFRKIIWIIFGMVVLGAMIIILSSQGIIGIHKSTNTHTLTPIIVTDTPKPTKSPLPSNTPTLEPSINPTATLTPSPIGISTTVPTSTLTSTLPPTLTPTYGKYNLTVENFGKLAMIVNIDHQTGYDVHMQFELCSNCQKTVNIFGGPYTISAHEINQDDHQLLSIFLSSDSYCWFLGSPYPVHIQCE